LIDGNVQPLASKFSSQKKKPDQKKLIVHSHVHDMTPQNMPIVQNPQMTRNVFVNHRLRKLPHSPLSQDVWFLNLNLFQKLKHQSMVNRFKMGGKFCMQSQSVN
jgi:hypothetical protein